MAHTSIMTNRKSRVNITTIIAAAVALALFAMPISSSANWGVNVHVKQGHTCQVKVFAAWASDRDDCSLNFKCAAGSSDATCEKKMGCAGPCVGHITWRCMENSGDWGAWQHYNQSGFWPHCWDVPLNLP